VPNNPNQAKPSAFRPKRTTVSKERASFRKRSASAPIWDAVSADLVHALVCACTTCNAPPTFGYTRDGTSLTIAVYYEGERYVDYLSGQEEVVEYFMWCVNDLLNLTDEERTQFAQMKF
jgi:hypothetical protein